MYVFGQVSTKRGGVLIIAVILSIYKAQASIPWKTLGIKLNTAARKRK